MNKQQLIDDILTFWFADIGNDFDIKAQHKLWYFGGPDLDEEIRRRFGAAVETALACDSAGQWSPQYRLWLETCEGAMALVLLLDQFTRNIYRGQARAFSGDAGAQGIVKKGLQRGLDRQLSYVQRTFFYMPLEHSESMEDQTLCVDLFSQLLQEVPTEGKETIASSLRFAEQHREIIANFGRFPYRNAVLGRDSTAEEVAYLEGGGARFGQ